MRVGAGGGGEGHIAKAKGCKARDARLYGRFV